MEISSLPKLKNSVKDFLDSDSGYATATKVVFAILLLAGVLTIAAMAPNIFSAFGRYRRPRKYSGKQLKSALYGLRRQGLVEFIKEEGDEITVKLNYAKQNKIKKFAMDIMSIPSPKKWNGKWRILIFDVPVKFNKAREAMTSKLKELGFYPLQKSVWVHPFPCEDEILFIAGIFKIEKFIDILIAESILNEDKIKKFFNL